jgi:hypothetical protein
MSSLVGTCLQAECVISSRQERASRSDMRPSRKKQVYCCILNLEKIIADPRGPRKRLTVDTARVDVEGIAPNESSKRVLNAEASEQDNIPCRWVARQMPISRRS